MMGNDTRGMSAWIPTTALAVLLAGAAAAQAPAYDAREAFTQSDADHDGQVDHEEFIERVTEVYFHSDRDKNGMLNGAELDAATLQTADIDVVDVNKDGTATLHEFRRQRLRAFDAADTDDNGTLSASEVTTVTMEK
jgi:Ca2+-binding EF-hand superfamily protein